MQRILTVEKGLKRKFKKRKLFGSTSHQLKSFETFSFTVGSNQQSTPVQPESLTGCENFIDNVKLSYILRHIFFSESFLGKFQTPWSLTPLHVDVSFLRIGVLSYLTTI